MNVPHTHAALIKAWADGAEIQYMDPHGRQWIDLNQNGITWSPKNEYRVKPEITTSLSDKELYAIKDKVWESSKAGEVPLDIAYRAYRAVADAAIKQYIKDTQKQ